MPCVPGRQRHYRKEEKKQELPPMHEPDRGSTAGSWVDQQVTGLTRKVRRKDRIPPP